MSRPAVGTLIPVGATTEDFFTMNMQEYTAALEDPNKAEILANSPLAMGSIVASKPAREAMVSYGVIMNAIANSQTAMDAVAHDQLTMAQIVGNTTSMYALAQSHIAMNTLITSETALSLMVNSEIAVNQVANSQVAMNVLASSEAGREALINSQLAMNIIYDTNMAVSKLVAGFGGLNPVDYLDADMLVNNETTITMICNSEEAMSVVVKSRLVMDNVANHEIAMNIVATSEIARNAINTSEIARDAINNSSMAVVKLAVGFAGLDPLDYSGIGAVVNDQTTLNAIAVSAEALDVLFDSWPVREAIWDSTLACNTLLSNTTSRDWMTSHVAISSRVETESYTMTWSNVLADKALVIELRGKGPWDDESTNTRVYWRYPSDSKSLSIRDGYSLFEKDLRLTSFQHGVKSSNTGTKAYYVVMKQ